MAKETKEVKVVQRTMQVRLLSFNKGVTIYNGVKMVRLRSRKYNLLIMADYLSTLGEIEGTVIIVTPDEEIKLENIRGYYVNKPCVLTMVIEGELDV